MNSINIKQIKNLPYAYKGAVIVYNGISNVWSNQDTGAILVPAGTSSQRPISAFNGFIRYNTTSNLFEFYQNGYWKKLNEIELSSLGVSGESLYELVSGNSELILRRVEGRGIVNVYSSSGTIYISAPPISTTITVSSFGGGINPIINVSGSEIQTRTLEGGGIVELSSIPNGKIVVSAPSIIKIPVLQSSHGFSQGNVIYLDDNDGLWKLAIATSADTLGVAIANVLDSNNFEAVFAGKVNGFSNLIPGNFYFTSSVSAGGIQITEPSAYSNPILYAITSSTAIVLPYRPSETNDFIHFSVSGLGTGISVIRNVEGPQLIYRTLVNSSTVRVSASNSTIEFNVLRSSITIPEKIYYRAGDFDNPDNNDWFAPLVAPAISDALNNALTVRLFSFKTSGPYEGVGGIFRVPDERYDKVRMGFAIRAPNPPVSNRQIVLGFGFRRIPNNSPISPWIVTALPSFSIPSLNTNYLYYETPFYSISGLGMVNNQITQFEIWRYFDNANDTFQSNIYLLEFYIEFKD